jgi:NAD(P)-dependent dehydrogenase (short-subunit alcohol dehydrogenase family)
VTSTFEVNAFLQADMSKEADVECLVQEVLRQCGRIDIWINNAARFVFKLATEVTEEGKASTVVFCAVRASRPSAFGAYHGHEKPSM